MVLTSGCYLVGNFLMTCVTSKCSQGFSRDWRSAVVFGGHQSDGMIGTPLHSTPSAGPSNMRAFLLSVVFIPMLAVSQPAEAGLRTFLGRVFNRNDQQSSSYSSARQSAALRHRPSYANTTQRQSHHSPNRTTPTVTYRRVYQQNTVAVTKPDNAANANPDSVGAVQLGTPHDASTQLISTTGETETAAYQQLSAPVPDAPAPAPTELPPMLPPASSESPLVLPNPDVPEFPQANPAEIEATPQPIGSESTIDAPHTTSPLPNAEDNMHPQPHPTVRYREPSCAVPTRAVSCTCSACVSRMRR